MGARSLAVHIAVLALMLAVPARAAEPSPEQLGQELIRRQAGVDKAHSFLLVWKWSSAEQEGRPLGIASLAWQGRHIFTRHESPQSGGIETSVVAPDRALTVTTAAHEEPQAYVHGFAMPNSAFTLNLASTFFPVLRHWWMDFREETEINANSRQHPERLRRIAEALTGRELTAEEALAVLREHPLLKREREEPEFCSVPPEIHQAPPGRVAVGCRTAGLGWFSILEFDSETHRLMGLIMFVNRQDAPREVMARVHGPTRPSPEETWQIQQQCAFPWGRIEYSDHKELSLGIVLPMRVDMYNRDEGVEGEGHSVYRITRVEVNPELPEDTFEVQIPDGARTGDFTLDPRGLVAVDYEWSAELQQPDRRQALAQDARLQDQLEQRRRMAELLGSPAPPLVGVSWINRDAVSLEEFRGSYVLLSFMSVRSLPCRRQAEELVRWTDTLAEANARVIGVFHAGDSQADVRVFAKENGLAFPICVARGAGLLETFTAYGVQGPLHACLVDPDGTFIDEGSQQDLLMHLVQLRRAREARTAEQN